MDAYDCRSGGGVIVGGKLVDEVVATTGGEKFCAVVEASGVRRIHDLRESLGVLSTIEEPRAF